MRILVVPPLFPFPPKGACDQDSAEGVQQLLRLGHQVGIFCLLKDYQDPELVKTTSKSLNVPIWYETYPNIRKRSFESLTHRFMSVLRNLSFLDGAAYVYHRPEVLRTYETCLEKWHPDLVWVDHTNLWPLTRLAKSLGIKTVVRSHNFEPKHLLDERGHSIPNYRRYVGKFLGELLSIRHSSALVAITPQERSIYGRLNYRRGRLHLLPLRGLPKTLRPPRPQREHTSLNVFFSCSNYNVAHMTRALRFLLLRVLPALRRRTGGRLKFYITGRKIPAWATQFRAEDLVLAGYVRDYDAFLENMDIAFSPSLAGAGMQQKLFEPLCRGFPTILSRRGIGGYPIEHRAHALVVTQNSAEEFVDYLIEMQSLDLRTDLSQQASQLCKTLFSQKILDNTVEAILEDACRSCGD